MQISVADRGQRKHHTLKCPSHPEQNPNYRTRQPVVRQSVTYLCWFLTSVSLPLTKIVSFIRAGTLSDTESPSAAIAQALQTLKMNARTSKGEVKITLGKGLENASNFAIPKDKGNMSEDLGGGRVRGKNFNSGVSCSTPTGGRTSDYSPEKQKGSSGCFNFTLGFFGNQLH